MCSIGCNNVNIVLVLLSIVGLSYCTDYHAIITSNSPIVQGAQINFTSSLYYGKDLAKGNFKYFWEDYSLDRHRKEILSSDPVDHWNVQYNASTNPPGVYVVQIVIEYCVARVFCYQVASNRQEFEITETLNGNIALSQKNVNRDNLFVSSVDPVLHKINLSLADSAVISKAPSILTYWFVDCEYLGVYEDKPFLYNYTSAGSHHTIETLMIADFNPPTPPPTTTTTTTVKPTTTSTTIKPTKPTSTPKPTTPTTTTMKTTTKPNKTTDENPPQVISNSIVKSIQKRSAKNETADDKKKEIMIRVNGTLVPYNVRFPLVCNGSRIATDEKKIYGYFRTNIEVKAPISKVNITGNNWLQHGDLLDLKVTCEGSQNLEYCALFMTGTYNITGNETCPTFYQLDSCSTRINRFLITDHTVVIILKNDVSKVVKPVAITIYKATIQSQLSVIVVPVAFSMVAVVLIVFGIAYYIQNRSRFVVEVADFNFGTDYTDMEYKTFTERLKEELLNAFTRTPDADSPEPPNWPRGRKYGSMT